MSIESVHFSDLAARDPREVVQRTDAAWDAASGEYRIRVWGGSYRVNPSKGRVLIEKPGIRVLPDYMDLFIVHYLMTARDLALANEWVSEKDIPGGAAFFRGPHTLPADEIGLVFGENIAGFAEVCRRLGGRPLAMADSAFVFDITPKLPVAVLIWEGDEDFGPDAGLLFDATIARHLALDIIFALAVLVCKTLTRAKESQGL